MRITLSIAISVIMLLSGMHVTLAIHYCGGKIAATKFSFTGKSAFCGMENTCKSNAGDETLLTSHCCDNEITAYNLNSDYSPSEFHSIKISHVFTEYPQHTARHATQSIAGSAAQPTGGRSPGSYTANTVHIADLCNLRI